MVSYIETVNLGTIYREGVELPAPPVPSHWNNIDEFVGPMNLYSMGNTSTLSGNAIRWNKILVNDKEILYCDRVLMNEISWEDLNSVGWITGSKVTIDGADYLLRIMKAGEWEEVVLNTDPTSGLPIPGDLDSPHNDFWNWGWTLSWTNDGSGSSRLIWGYESADESYDEDIDSKFHDGGWRPVLEPVGEEQNQETVKMAMNIGGEIKNYAQGWVKIDGDARKMQDIWTKVNGELKQISRGSSL